MEQIIDRIVNSLCTSEDYKKEHSRIYKIHKYWARKPWYIVEKYISKYSSPGDVVMDPFCGSGSTGLESIINGRNFIGQDLNPTALQVTKGTLMHDINFDSLMADFDRIQSECKTQIMNLYVTSEKCDNCKENLYFKYINIGPKYVGKLSGGIYCDTCKSKTVKRQLNEEELKKMNSYNSINIDKWIPETPFPKKFYKDRFSYKGILTVSDMYTKRNLYALSLLYDSVHKSLPENIELLMLAFTNTVLHVSKLKGENVRPLGVNNYWIPDDYIEENVWFRFEDRAAIVFNAKRQQLKREKEKEKLGLKYGNYEIKKKSALESMGRECVDYFFTDPPYGDAIQYSELSYVWNAWLKTPYETEEEVIINPVQNKGSLEFQRLLSVSLDNIYEALKEKGHFTLCFQNKSFDIWQAVIEHCKKIGFKLLDISIYDTYGSPFNKSWANFSPKSDIYVTFVKDKDRIPEFYNKVEDISGIIKEVAQYMESKQIPNDNNRLYDLVISYLIWAMYHNENKIDIKGFNIKKFVKLAEEVLSV
jgi:hypothetical protein